ncbi:MAG: hypothetical protein QX198_07490 [Methylococcaceae bacterium]
MTTYNRSLWFTPALLVSVVAVIIIVSMSIPVHNADVLNSASPTSAEAGPALKNQHKDIYKDDTSFYSYDLSQFPQGVVGESAALTSVPNAKLAQTEQKAIDIRKEEEQRLKKLDKSYAQQAKMLAKRYQETAKLIKNQGGDPQPLLDAAAYFNVDSK